MVRRWQRNVQIEEELEGSKRERRKGKEKGNGEEKKRNAEM